MFKKRYYVCTYNEDASHLKLYDAGKMSASELGKYCQELNQGDVHFLVFNCRGTPLTVGYNQFNLIAAALRAVKGAITSGKIPVETATGAVAN